LLQTEKNEERNKEENARIGKRIKKLLIEFMALAFKK
jgi:hypothetical protein